MKKNEYRMWPNGPSIELPEEYHWDATAQEIVKNDLSWRGDLMAFWNHQKVEVGPALPWPEYDEDDDSGQNETSYLFELEAEADDETTCQEITDALNERFGNNRTADEVQDRLRQWDEQ